MREMVPCKSVRPWIIPVGLCVLIVILTGTAAGTQTRITVDDDGPSDFDTIQGALDAAAEGETIEVTSGTYHESIDISKNVTLVAPNGATLAYPSTESESTDSISKRSGIRIFGSASPVISGFTLRGWDQGVEAFRTTNDWELRDTLISGSECGVCATESAGDWELNNVSIDGPPKGIVAYHSSGDWTVDNAVIHNISYKGITVDHSTGAWTITSTNIHNVSTDDGIDIYQTKGGVIKDVSIISTGEDGINMYDVEGEFTIENVVIRDVVADGINAGSGNESSVLSIRNVTIQGTGDSGVAFYNSSADWRIINSVITGAKNETIEAGATKGNWRVTQSVLSDGNGEAIDAYDSEIAGNASYNYWGPEDGPSGKYSGSGGAAVGNVMVRYYYSDRERSSVESVGNITQQAGSSDSKDSSVISMFERFANDAPLPIALIGSSILFAAGFMAYRRHS